MKKLIKLLIISSFIGIIIPLFLINVVANEVVIDESIFNTANTYNLGINKKEDHYKFTFDKNNKNDKEVEDEASFTFMTHGLNGQASDFSRTVSQSKNKFGYNERSIINLLNNKYDINIYLCDFTDQYHFDTYKITGKTEYNKTLIDNITDYSKHSVVFFNGYNTGASNDYIYSEFNIMASTIISNYYNQKNILPKVNLIGHSRGGLTNLQYTLDHPDLVSSLYSINTPYFGTSIDTINYNVIEDDSVVDSDGAYDIQDKDTYMSYYNRWNDNYDKLYKDIDCHALGMYQDLAMVLYQVSFSIYYNLVEEHSGIITLLYSFYEALAEVAGMNIKSLELFNIFSRYSTSEEGDLAFDKLYSELQKEEGKYVLKFDGLVDLDSQLARYDYYNYSYKGFNRFEYKLSFKDDYDLRYSVRNTLVITHAAAPYLNATLNYFNDNFKM